MHTVNAETTVGFLNGQWQPVGALRISIDDLGFLQAVTAVERLRSYGGKLFQHEAHLDRLRRTAAYLQVDLSGIGIESLLVELLDRNAAWIASQLEYGVTLFVTPGSRNRGVPTVGMHCNALDQPQIAQRQATGQAIVVTGTQQPLPESWPRHLKVRCRLHYYLADQAAEDVCAGALGVLLDQDGTLTETSVANLAIVRGDKIVSPPAERILPGITQRFLESYARTQQLQWVHRPLPPESLQDADEILLFGTTTGVWNGWLAGSRPRDAALNQRMSTRLRKAFPIQSY